MQLRFRCPEEGRGFRFCQVAEDPKGTCVDMSGEPRSSGHIVCHAVRLGGERKSRISTPTIGDRVTLPAEMAVLNHLWYAPGGIRTRV